MNFAPLFSLKERKSNNRFVIDKYTILMMTYAQPYFSYYEYITLTRDDVDNENAMLATNKQIHNSNRIKYKLNDIAQTLNPYFCSYNKVHSPATMAITKMQYWLQTKYVEP